MRHRALLAGGCVLLALVLASSAQARRPLTTGFNVQPVFTDPSSATRSLWFGRAVYEGGSIVRVDVSWNLVAPKVRPPSFNPADPSSPGYDWSAVDAAVRDVNAGHMRVLLTLLGAPRWAEGPGMPSSAFPGTWQPDASQYGAFAKAAATRYSGHFPDPAVPGASLPQVRLWQAWNEPNLSNYIAPQWTSSGGTPVAQAPVIYRNLLNAFYGAVKQVSSANFVVSAGLAPFGDPPGGERIPPVAFYRDLFCLQDNRKLSPLSCPDPPHLDAISHHPYGIGGPLWKALTPDDAAVPDVYKITRVLNAAERTHHVLPRGRKQVWDTEISWDSNPPDPQGVPIQKQARWVEQTMYVLWSQGVDTILWLQIVDSPPIPNYGATNQGGSYYLDGQPKPSAQALRFPFVTQRKGKKKVLAWGRTPQAGRLKIQVLRGRRWVTIKRMRVRNRQVFTATLPLRHRFVARAVLGGQQSLTWTQSR
jgi:hypothetical protein